MAKAVIHVNRQHIAQNHKDGGKRPVYTIKQGRKTTYAHGIEIEGKVRLIDPRVTPPLKCGARAWIELVEGDLNLIDPCSYVEARQPQPRSE